MRPLPPDPDRLTRWMIAAALAALAVALQWSVRPWVGTRIPFLFFLPAIVVAAARCGSGGALLVAATGLASACFWLRPAGHGWVAGTTDTLSLLIYCLLGLLLSSLGGRLRLSRARASAAEQRLVLAGEDTGVGIFDLDLATGQAYLSPVLAQLCGVDAGSDAVAVDAVLARLPAAAAAEARAVFAAKLREGARGYERELRLVLPDGRVRWLMLRVHIAWAGTRATHLRGACVDITDRRAIDELLERTKGELSQQVTDLHRLHDLGNRLLEVGDLPAQMRVLLATLADFHGARRGVLALSDTRSGTLGIAAATGFEPAVLARLLQTPGIDGACALTCANRTRTVIADTADAAIDPPCARSRARRLSAPCTRRR
jgi:PAS domain-containing protein